MTITQPRTVPVYEWLLEGQSIGCGTKVEFDYWNDEGANPEGLILGGIIAHEPVSEDERRMKAWGLA